MNGNSNTRTEILVLSFLPSLALTTRMIGAVLYPYRLNRYSSDRVVIGWSSDRAPRLFFIYYTVGCRCIPRRKFLFALHFFLGYLYISQPNCRYAFYILFSPTARWTENSLSQLEIKIRDGLCYAKESKKLYAIKALKRNGLSIAKKKKKSLNVYSIIIVPFVLALDPKASFP